MRCLQENARKAASGLLLDASPGKLESHEVEAENPGRHRRWDSAGFEGNPRRQKLLWTDLQRSVILLLSMPLTTNYGAMGK